MLFYRQDYVIITQQCLCNLNHRQTAPFAIQQTMYLLAPSTQKHLPWVFNILLDLNQKGDSLPPVEQTVIVGKCEVHHLQKLVLVWKDVTTSKNIPVELLLFH